jgi:transcriptional regulator with XRE-family HTH domain
MSRAVLSRNRLRRVRKPVLHTKATGGRLALGRLMGHLGLSQDELGRMLGVTGESVRRWKTGAIAIPLSRLAEITAAESALNRLLQVFRTERLPLAIRRKAELFGGRRALDWILDGRIAEVADRYELSLAYQA